MKILLYYNPISGQGRSLRAATKLKPFLELEGYSVVMRNSKDTQGLESLVKDIDALVVLGGDGTLMYLIPVLQATGTPVYKLPMGVESLFSKEFKMSSEPKRVLQALKSGSASARLPGTVNGQQFFTMVSLGLDSAVVEKVAAVRSSPIGRFGYVWPTIKSLLLHQAPVITLRVDGREVIREQPGFLIIANTSQYALGLKYTPEANSEDQNLVARFFPYKSVFKSFLWSMDALLRTNRPSHLPFFSGQHFEVETMRPYPVQADGEYMGITPVSVSVSKEPIQVITGTR